MLIETPRLHNFILIMMLCHLFIASIWISKASVSSGHHGAFVSSLPANSTKPDFHHETQYERTHVDEKQRSFASIFSLLPWLWTHVILRKSLTSSHHLTLTHARLELIETYMKVQSSKLPKESHVSSAVWRWNKAEHEWSRRNGLEMLCCFSFLLILNFFHNEPHGAGVAWNKNTNFWIFTPSSSSSIQSVVGSRSRRLEKEREEICWARGERKKNEKR